MRRGFTLLELIVAIAIVALLLTVALPNYYRHSEKLSVVDARHKLLEIMHLENKYFSEHATYTVGITSDLGMENPVSERGDYRIVANACSVGIHQCVELRAIAIKGDKPDLIIDSLGNKHPKALWK